MKHTNTHQSIAEKYSCLREYLKSKAATVAEVENFTNMEMSKITQWSKENKLHFNDQKSKVMLITRRRKERKAIDIYLNNNHLEQVDKIKYLGIIIDSKFKFNEHIKYISDRCTKIINVQVGKN
jgi:hypothetical protein